MKKNTTLLVSLGVLILVIGGGVLLVKSLSMPVSTSPEEEEEVVQLPPADPSIEVTLGKGSDSKSVDLTVAKIPTGTESVEYELSYITGEGLPKGALGKISLSGKDNVARNILLGTCSRNTCSYDTGVTSVKLVLRFNHPDGATQLTKEYPLE